MLDKEIWDFLEEFDKNWEIKISITSEELEKLLNLDKITEEEKKVLTKSQLKEFEETWILEWEFVYKNWKPVKFISIDDIDFS